MRRALAAVAAAAVLLGACDGGDPTAPPGESDVAVDTPELREQKAAAGIEDCEPGTGDGDGSELPDLVLPCLGGGPDVDLSTIEGPALLNVWWSGCGPCRDEMPVLQQLHEQHGDQVRVIGLDVETYPGSAISFAESVGATYPQLADPGGTVFDSADFRLSAAFPQTVVVDADGRVVFKEAVEFQSLDEVVGVLEDSLGVTL